MKLYMLLIHTFYSILIQSIYLGIRKAIENIFFPILVFLWKQSSYS